MKTNFTAALARWVVPDVPADMSGIEFVFILESPHKAEILKKCPAAGTAGKAMASFLLGRKDLAFGEMILGGQTGRKYAIVNVCPVPMQESAYAGQLSAEQKSLVDELGRLRNPNLKSVDAGIYSAMLENFKARLAKVNGKAKLIPCGKFAQKAFADAGFENIYDIPHPSFGNWHKKKYKQAMERLKAELGA